MATFYTDSNQRVAAPMMYLRDHSYPETSLLPNTMMLYMNSSASYSDSTLGGNNSQQQQQQQPLPSNCIDISTVGSGMESNFSGSRITDHDFNGRDTHDMLIMNHPSSILQNSGQGLSLRLGTEIPGGFQMPSSPNSHYRNPSVGLVSFLNPNPEEGGGSRRNNNCSSLQNENCRNIMEYVQAAGFNQDSASVMQQQGAAVRSIPNSRYLKAAQQLLEEVVNVRNALKQADEAKDHQSKENEGRAKSYEDGDGDGADSSPKDSVIAAKELSHSEKQELQNKLTKLLTMLDEVDKRYKQYYHQMQFVVSSFDAVAGPGAAKPYTALALQRISRHFRCLRDAISGQIQAVRGSLGEQDSNNGVGIARLRYVDQQLKQQRALQQLGMMQPHAWRPQRGLPESSVSILRAWLFEHFLHPYPKDSDKIMLARQTGLTRSQVSNWFINARVRLWKPMVEEMYKEETGEAEMDSNSSSENGLKALSKANVSSSEDRGEDMMMKKSSSNFEKLTDPRPNHSHMQQQDIEMVGSSGGAAVASFLTGPHNHPSLYHPTMSNAETAFQMSELGRIGNGTGVSLTLGLQHFEGGGGGGGGGMSFSGGSVHHHHHHGFVPIRRDDDEFYSTMGGSSVGTEEASEYDVVNNNSGTQHRHQLGPGHQQLLHDFVA